ncbi:MAG: mechanosensitive ion channel family protein [Rhodothermales bacterium]|nr:mechanosensitive ion channel family protein [Rhodothermales bacterium]
MDLLNEIWISFKGYFAGDNAFHIYKALVILLAGYLLAKALSAFLLRSVRKRTSPHHAMLLRRVSFYTVIGVFSAWALVSTGFELGILLGAAGVLTVALGFASQTSATNIISGLFLIGEKPFALGDIIRVGTITGEVLSIDLLSVKIRTFDNLFVRIANENLIKSDITNLSRFPIRRIDTQIRVGYREDLKRVVEVLKGVASDNPLCLQEPKPLFIFNLFEESFISFQYSVWTLQENYLDVKNMLFIEIKCAFDAHGIEIPMPYRRLVVEEGGAFRVPGPANDEPG